MAHYKLPQPTDDEKKMNAAMQQAVASGICPVCKSPMIPSADSKASTCSAHDCNFGVVTKCKTYKPAIELFGDLKKARELSTYEVAWKIRGPKAFAINGVQYVRVRAIGIKQAKLAVSRRQLTMLECEGAPKRKEPFRLGKDQVIAVTQKGKLAVFERAMA